MSLHISGLSSNRVNLVFFSDGCMYTTYCAVYRFIFGIRTDTPDEQSKFMDDAARLAEDIIGNQTFSTVKPLLNIWAAFSPSNEVFTCSFSYGYDSSQIMVEWYWNRWHPKSVSGSLLD